MPELPEIETIKNQLDKYLVGHKVEKIEVRLRKMLPDMGEKNLVGAKIKSVQRFGKMLVVNFNNDHSAVFHLKLTGQVIYVPKDSKKNHKYTHVVFHLDHGAKLIFNCLRQFGWVKIIQTDKVKKEKNINTLGPDPTEDLTLTQFQSALFKTRRPIKVVLLDQTVLSGVGNIYAVDALNLAKIAPTKPTSSLSSSEVKKLFVAIKKVLKAGIKYHGSSEQYYLDALGRKGKYQDHFLVYSREGKPCFNCGRPIKKIRLAGRGTYFCPDCQT